MSDNHKMEPEILDLKVGTSYAAEEVHFSGGIRGSLTDLGWALFPISEDRDNDALVFKDSKAHLDFATNQCGLRFLGTCTKHTSSPNAPQMLIWEFGARDPSNGLDAAASWGTIKHRAEMAGDARYSEIASYISASLRAASLRLRDVSNGYHSQLRWALADRRGSGTWFSNAALQDIHSDFHSLLSELSSARDHVATIAAIHVGAPNRIDSLSRLEDWLEKPSNRRHSASPMVLALLSALGSEATPGWLRRMGDRRNEMLHRVPMSASRAFSGLVVERVVTSIGEVPRIRLGAPTIEKPPVQQPHDPLIETSTFSWNLETLCRLLWKHAKYPAEPIHFKVATPPTSSV